MHCIALHTIFPFSFTLRYASMLHVLILFVAVALLFPFSITKHIVIVSTCTAHNVYMQICIYSSDVESAPLPHHTISFHSFYRYMRTLTYLYLRTHDICTVTDTVIQLQKQNCSYHMMRNCMMSSIACIAEIQTKQRKRNRTTTNGKEKKKIANEINRLISNRI